MRLHDKRRRAAELMVRRSSAIRGYRDLAGKTVVYTAETTNEAVMRKINERNHLGIKFVSVPDRDASFAMVEDGKADAFAADDVLLSGLIATPCGGPPDRRRRLPLL